MAKSTFDVVYVDDDPMMTELFNQFISWKYRQWRACAYTDPVMLWNQIRSGEVTARVWIIDIMMPDKNGAEIACTIREKYGNQAPIMGYTALEPATLQNDPQYSTGLHYFSQIIRKNEGIARLLQVTDDLLKNQVVE